MVTFHTNYLIHSFIIFAIFIIPLSFSSAQTSTTTPISPDTKILIKQLQALIISLQSQINDLKAKLEATQKDVEVVKSEIQFTKSLARGTEGDEVKQLQEVLSKDPEIYPEGKVTGFFGPATEAAVKRFQEKHGIESRGIIGPKTREKLNQLITEGAGKSGVIPSGLEKKFGTPTPTPTPTPTLAPFATSDRIPAPPTHPFGYPGTTTVPAVPGFSATTSETTPPSAIPAIPAQPVGQTGITTVPATPAVPANSSPTPSPSPSASPTATTTDTTVPSSPTNLTATPVYNWHVTLTWSKSTDNVSVVGYRVYRNGTQLFSAATSSSLSTLTYRDWNVTTGTNYSYTVAAYDGAGNVSVQSNSVSVTPVAENTSPLPNSSPSPSSTGTVSVDLDGAPVPMPAITRGSTDVGVAGFRIVNNTSQPISVTNIQLVYQGCTCSSSYAPDFSAVWLRNRDVRVGQILSPLSTQQFFTFSLSSGELVISAWGSEYINVRVNAPATSSGAPLAPYDNNFYIEFRSMSVNTIAGVTGLPIYFQPSLSLKWPASSPSPSPSPTPTTLAAPTGIRASISANTWNANMWGKVSQSVDFTYTLTSDTSAFRLYEKKLGAGSFTRIAEFTNLSSGVTCGTWTLVGSWSIINSWGGGGVCNKSSWVASLGKAELYPVSLFPEGAYEYYVVAVNTAGVEGTPSVIGKVNVLSPLTVVTPSGSSPSTPIFKWTVSNGWPSGIWSGPYFIRIAEAGSTSGPLWSADWVSINSANGYTYTGLALNPTKTYVVHMYGHWEINNQTEKFASFPAGVTSFTVSAATTTSATATHTSLATILNALNDTLLALQRMLRAVR